MTYPMWRRPFELWEFMAYTGAAVIGAWMFVWGPSKIGAIWLTAVLLIGLMVADFRAKSSRRRYAPESEV